MRSDRKPHHSSILRHVLSAILGLVLAPVIWGLTAWSTYRFGSITRSVDAMSQLDEPGSAFIMPILLLAAAGAFVGLLLGTQLSPLGAGLAGLGMLTTASAFLITPTTMLDKVAALPGEQDLVLALPAAAGSAFLLGTALLIPLFSSARWRWVPTPDTEPPTPVRKAIEPPRAEEIPAPHKRKVLVPAPRQPMQGSRETELMSPVASTTTGRHRALSEEELTEAKRRVSTTASTTATGRHVVVDSELRSTPHRTPHRTDTYAGRSGTEIPKRRQIRQTEPIPSLLPDSGELPRRPNDTLTRYAVLRPEALDEPDFVWHIDRPN